MSPRVLEIVQKITARDFPGGTVIFQEGAETTNEMYFVFSGEVSIYKERDGKSREINRIKPGNFFGEMALIQSRPRLATARVVSESAKLAIINKAMLLQLAGSSPEFLFYLLRHAVSRLLIAEDKLQAIREDIRNEKLRRGII